MGETAGDALVAHPDVDKIAFTGHVDTAKIIQKAAADTLKRTTFELGGKSPNVIFADADLDAAVAGAIPRHLLPRRPVLHGRQPAVRRVQRSTTSSSSGWPRRPRAASLGDPLDTADRAGPAGLAGAARQDPPLRRTRARSRGPACHRRRAGRHQGLFVQPTIFDDVKDDMAIATDEIFGPVVSVLPFKGIDEVIERANKTDYGLAAAIWTKDIDKAHLDRRKVKAGTVWVNCYHVFDASRPVRRIQDAAAWPRDRRGRARALHRAQDRDRRARLHECLPSIIQFGFCRKAFMSITVVELIMRLGESVFWAARSATSVSCVNGQPDCAPTCWSRWHRRRSCSFPCSSRFRRITT